VTRAGVAAFSKTLSKEIPATSNITVNTILTGGCKTERFFSLLERQASQTGESVDKVLERLLKSVPVGYFSTPGEFAKTVLFLSSKDSSYLNGLALPIDGGTLKSVF